MQAHSYPSQLALACQESVKARKVADNLLQGLPDNQFGQCLNSTHHYETIMNRNQSRLTDPLGTHLDCSEKDCLLGAG